MSLLCGLPETSLPPKNMGVPKMSSFGVPVQAHALWPFSVIFGPVK